MTQATTITAKEAATIQKPFQHMVVVQLIGKDSFKEISVEFSRYFVIPKIVDSGYHSID